MKAKSLPCALLGSFTLDQVVGMVTSRLEPAGVNCQWFVAPFNQYPQLILSEPSELLAQAPKVAFLAVAIEDLLGSLPSPWAHPVQRQTLAEERLADFFGLVRRMAERLPGTAIFVHDFLPVAPAPNTVLASGSSASLAAIARQANAALRGVAAEFPNVRVVCLEDVFASLARSAIGDPRFYYIAKMRFGRAAMECLADFYCRLIRAYLGLRKKCLVLDLDNTLWGGVIGEVGPDKILLSDDGPGKAFQDMQRNILDYYETGTLLAVCSKNDEALALGAIRDHPAMILRPNHFAAMRINWQDKASNIREIATELNLGIDSMVFLDDSEYERAEVRRLEPTVTVVDLPKDPAGYPAFVAQLPFFDALTTTEDDRRRGQMYVEDRQRRELGQQARSLEDFLTGLEIEVTVQKADAALLPRLAQLTQRTNQFNLTTRRYTDHDLATMSQSPDWRLYCVSTRDRIGDAGIVGGALIQLDRAQAVARLDTLMLSCRILGRGIETAFLAGLLLGLEDTGVATIIAEYIPTDRNAVAKEFLPRHGFVQKENFWHRSAAAARELCPKWINLKTTS
jgi:FkbH-like protein